jgi:yeast amino acid transporter
MLAIIVNGILTICVMECVSEFTQLFPAPNAIVKIVAAFVDEDLAWVVGIAYWCSDYEIRELLSLRLTTR